VKRLKEIVHMKAIALNDFLKVLLSFQLLRIRPKLTGRNFLNIKSVWVDGQSHKPIEPDQLTLLVKTQIQKIIPHSNITPIDFRRYWPSLIIQKKMKLPGFIF
jgi:hypothetical protein